MGVMKSGNLRMISLVESWVLAEAEVTAMVVQYSSGGRVGGGRCTRTQEKRKKEGRVAPSGEVRRPLLIYNWRTDAERPEGRETGRIVS